MVGGGSHGLGEAIQSLPVVMSVENHHLGTGDLTLPVVMNVESHYPGTNDATLHCLKSAALAEEG